MQRFLATTVLILAAVFTAHAQAASAPKGESHVTYSADQATRGKALYAQYCSKCHMENLKGSCPAENLSSTAYVCAAPGSAPPLVEASFMQRFYSVSDLYARVKWTMPANKVNSLSIADNLRIVAYLLQANGIAAGSEDLKEGAAMKAMAIGGRSAAKSVSTKITEPLNDLGIRGLLH